jgi:hypothetical protein
MQCRRNGYEHIERLAYIGTMLQTVGTASCLANNLAPTRPAHGHMVPNVPPPSNLETHIGALVVCTGGLLGTEAFRFPLAATLHNLQNF